MSNTTTTELAFDAKALAAAFSATKNRATQVREVGKAVAAGLDPKAIYAATNEYYYAENRENLPTSRLSNTAVANLRNTFELVDSLGLADSDRHMAKALNVVEKGQSTALEEFHANIAELDRDDKGYAIAVYKFLLVANERALELRKAPKSTPTTPEDGEPEEEQEVAKESLVTVILRNVAALDLAGTTAEEREALLEMAESLMTRVIRFAE